MITTEDRALAAMRAPAGKSVSIPGVPEYYVAWMQASTPYLVVGDTATGSVGDVIKAPKDANLQGVYGAAANDRTFILVGNLVLAPGNVNFFYRLRIAPDGTSARLTALRTPVLEAPPAGVAISPDGTEFAVALAGSPATIRIYSVATGKVLRTWSATAPGAVAAEPAAVAHGSQFTAASTLRWSSDGKQLAFAWNSTAIRVLDVSAPDGNLITSSSRLAAIGTTVNKDSSVTCNASQGWELIAGGQGVICAGSQVALALAGGGGAECRHVGRTFVGFLEETKDDLGDVESNLTDFETECSDRAAYPDGAYIGWANADGSVVIGSQVWDGHVRFGLFRDGRFTPLPALPTSVPVPTGVLIGTDDW